MDVILQLADHFVLDKAWAKLVPMPASVLDYATPSPSQSSGISANASRLEGSASLLDTLARAALPVSLRPPPLSSILSHPASSSTPLPFSLQPRILSLSEQSAWPQDYIIRQILSVATLTMIGIVFLYVLFASLSYYLIFDKRMMRHPRFLKNQIRLEILCSMWAFPWMTLLTMPWFMGEVRGYSKLYADVEQYGWAYLIFSVPFFLVFTDYCIYWIHRWLHIPFLYKSIHKAHHKWIIPTPFASHAFHPVDGYSQSVPYHLFVFLFPMHRYLYLGLFVAVNFWSIFIHDSDMLVSAGSKWERLFNTPAHHTLHHIYFTCNYGQYFTWADKRAGSYRPPQADLDPILEVLALDKASVDGTPVGDVSKTKKVE